MVSVWRSGDQLLEAAGQGSGAGAVLWVVLLAFAFVAAIVFSCAEGMEAKGSAARTSGGGYVAGRGAGFAGAAAAAAAAVTGYGGGAGCGAGGGAGCGAGGGAGCGAGGSAGAGCGGGGSAGAVC